MFGLGDPTKDWPVVPGPAPNISSTLMQFDQLRFGAPIESARFLGRPDDFHWKGLPGKNCELLYLSKGLRLEFTDRRLSEVAFLIEGGASPVAPDGSRLTRATGKNAIVAAFGEPDPGGSDDTCLQVFHGHGVASDFYLDDDGHLTEWCLYPE